MAIAGTGMLVLTLACTRCLAVARLARNYENARHFLDWVEVEHPLDSKTLEAGEESGVCEGPPDGYGWHRYVDAMGDEEDGFYRVRLRIAWSDKGSNAFEEVSTYRYVGEREDR